MTAATNQGFVPRRPIAVGPRSSSPGTGSTVREYSPIRSKPDGFGQTANPFGQSSNSFGAPAPRRDVSPQPARVRVPSPTPTTQVGAAPNSRSAVPSSFEQQRTAGPVDVPVSVVRSSGPAAQGHALTVPSGPTGLAYPGSMPAGAVPGSVPAGRRVVSAGPHVPASSPGVMYGGALQQPFQGSQLYPMVPSSQVGVGQSFLTTPSSMQSQGFGMNVLTAPPIVMSPRSVVMSGGYDAVQILGPEIEVPPSNMGVSTIIREARRPHLMEVDLKALELRPDAPDLDAGWMETTRHFVSFHPGATPIHALPLPNEAPKPLDSVDGCHVASKPCLAAAPKVKTKANVEAVATFDQQLALNLPEGLQPLLVVYVWAQNMHNVTGHEELTLLGRNSMSLTDFSQQRRPITWPMRAIDGNEPIGDLILTLKVSSAPGPVQGLRLSDAKQDEVTLVWEPPANDHGSPVIGYRIRLLRKPEELDQNNPGPSAWWKTLCPCTESLYPCYVVGNLLGNTVYTFDVVAINVCGPGDEHHIDVLTMPVEPGPPKQPFIAEARDGCLCVAWRPPESDGGADISAFKVMMRKVLGASKWSLFAPSDSEAVWVDMGTVGALMDEQDRPAVYTAWVGPLEETSCEYRFQIIALNRVGPGSGSEMSDAYHN